MRRWNFSRYAISSCVAVALLAGCGVQQSPIGAPGALPQTAGSAPARSAAHRLSASYQQLYRFRHGSRPTEALIDVNGTLYGTTVQGGDRGSGTIYSVTTSGVHKLLYRFRGGSDGRTPHGLLNVNGTLYGTTTFGGDYSCGAGEGCGTVYSVSTSGAEKVLYAFKGGSDGEYPAGSLIDVDGTLYGTTQAGGGGCATDDECGTVFSITTSGAEKVLHSFTYPPVDGNTPTAGLVDVNGTLYGTTTYGGANLYFGMVFSVSTSGTEKELYSFGGGSDGAHPAGASLIDVNGTLYGTTPQGGTGCITGHSGHFAGCGTVFALTTSGQETVLHRFGSGGGDGIIPNTGLTDVSGTLYGTTYEGGAYGGGIVYSISTSGGETTLYSFGGEPADGNGPLASLLNVNGTLYGTTAFGGRHGHGTVFTLTP
jgi:uncharacterized repeat protein (TIGR03803 family)